MTRNYLKPVALFLAVNLLAEIAFPTLCYALTGGPSQPEMESFEPVGTTDMVDLFSGDFNYNIPLLDVGGYPMNIAYHSGIGMDQEASWTGLGWNINAGVISRAMRGLPDDFKGDQVKYETHIRNNETWGLNAGANFELLGLTKKQRTNSKTTAANKNKGDSTATAGQGYTSLAVNMGISQNNYRGLNIFFGASFRIPRSPVNIGFTASGQGGFEYDASFSKTTKSQKTSWNVGMGLGSRGGLRITGGYTRNSIGLGEATKKSAGSTNFPVQRAITFSPVCDIPTLSNSFSTRLQNYNITIGTSFWGAHQNFRLGGTYSLTELKDGNASRAAYGYMYAEGVSRDKQSSLQDFSREREAPLNPEIKNLPLVTSSYDILSVSGQGTGGMFRAHRKNFGIYYDPGVYSSTSNWGTAGAEVGFAPTSFHFGLNYTPTGADESSGMWDKDHGNMLHDFSFDHHETNKLNEPYYFQAGGEKVPADAGYYNMLRGDAAARLDLDGQGLKYYAKINPTLIVENQDNSPFTEYRTTEVRQSRSQLISTITAREASLAFGSMPTLRNYIPGVFSLNTSAYQTINRPVDDKGHHIGEITQTNPDGSRYVYAIPAYNNVQREVSFNVSGNAKDLQKGLVEYNGYDNSIHNIKGADDFFSSVETPGFAHSYLLTAVLSPNYVDADQDGKPSAGDLGDYVVFHYTRHNSAYKWRVPVEASKAQYQQGLLSDDTDDKANYMYGTKEIWYLHSIESRTHVAEFKVSPRNDALGVLGENGGKDDGQTLMKLDTIALYTLNDRLLNGVNATPVKKVVFEYDYSLCPGVPNNKYYGTSAPAVQKGKLTLKKLYFIYGHSGKGAMSPYSFNYGYNPGYNMAEYDRWGNYKPNTNPLLPNRDFPYVDQTQGKDSADLNASAWNMNEVQLPSGGVIKVNYESDDYAFVQDRKAMQMIQLVGATDKDGLARFTIDGNNDRLYKEETDRIYDYLVFKAPEGITTADQLRNQCFAFMGSNKLFFKFLIRIRDKQEYISGWCDISEVGFTGTDPGYAYVRVNQVDQGDLLYNKYDNVHPISKCAWQFATANMSKVLHPGSEPNGTGVNAFRGLFDSWGEALDMFRGQYQSLKVKNIASSFVPAKSWIRIESPFMFKYGGGCRVKELSFSDSWATMDQADKTGNYTQQYDYTTTDQQYSGYEKISSGVAAYEPMIGGEENPMRQLIETIQKTTNATLPAMELYVEEPFGESLYPSPGVGYSKVTVRNKPKEGVSRTGTGHSVNEFYTAREHPVKVLRTALESVSLGTGATGNLITSLLKVVTKNYYAASQGYSVIVNDMHGKPKATGIYSEMQNGMNESLLISEVRYEYQDGNTVKVLNRDGSISDTLIGQEIDMSMDLRENEQRDWNAGLEANIKFDWAPTIPAPIPVIWAIPLPKFNYSMSRRQSASVTKVIQRYGILKSTTVKDEGSLIKTSNLLYDKATGNVLLTQTSNTFDDPIYNFSYPAHFAYDGMGAAYENAGASDSVRIVSYGQTTTIHQPGLFMIGDEVAIRYEFSAFKAWVSAITPVTGGDKITFISSDGRFFLTPDADIVEGVTIPRKGLAKVIRSGRKNMLMPSVGEIMTSSDPASGSSFSLSRDKVIQASAQTFSDNWSLRQLSRELDSTSTYCIYQLNALNNPYMVGNKGLWGLYQQKAFIEDRTYAYAMDTTFTRTDGAYKDFRAYWSFVPSGPMSQNTSFKRWVNASTIKRINRRAQPIEVDDALGNSSAELYGYGENFVTASSSYARTRDIANDNFEEYTLLNNGCGSPIEPHWSFSNGKNDTLNSLPALDEDSLSYHSPVITSTFAHSGIRSLLLPPGGVRKVYNYTDTSVVQKFDTTISNPGYADLNVSGTQSIFSPEPGKKYLVSAWVKGRTGSTYDLSSFDSCYLRVRILANYATQQNIVFKAAGPVIEGWQRIEGSFTIPAGAQYIMVSAENSGRYRAYIDDVRIHPYESNMKTFVYHPVLLKVMAILDENNFASFYEYDREGKLIRIKKETVKGIMTIQESRNGIKKPLNP
ncbi:MAG: hypothetical protein V4658_03305 [Bacteroidota bacterium]